MEKSWDCAFEFLWETPNCSACLFISYITEIDLYNCLCSSTSWTHSNHFNGHIDTR